MENPEPLNFTLNGFDKFDLYQIRVYGDGNCYFHAFCMAHFIPYRTQKMDGKTIKRGDIVKTLRRDLARRLSDKVDPDDEHSPIIYETLGRGNMAEMGTTTEELTLESMENHINSNEWCGEEVQELISNEIEKNIFYINVAKQDVYITSDIDPLYKKRKSVVLLYFDGQHYDTCALRNKNGEYITHFQFENPFIQFLYERLKEKKGKI